MQEFFNRPDLDVGGSLETNDKSEGLFNEWFLYDFVLSNDKTPLANFINENPLGLSKNKMTFYQNLLRSHEYGLFEVLRVEIDRGLTLRNLQTGGEVYVYERKLTSQVEPGSVFFGRIGIVDDHYEIIGADSFSIEALDERVKKHFQRMKFKLTPKITHDIWSGR